jgi:hypothetical protein
MAVFTTHRHRGTQPFTVVLRAAIVVLTLATAAIHATLGGTLFLMNAVGYTALAIALVVPGPLARIRWLTRWALVGFTAVTVGGWLIFGARFDLAYLDKGIELALIGLLLLESWIVDGGPLGAVRRARRIADSILG